MKHQRRQRAFMAVLAIVMVALLLLPIASYIFGP